MACVVVLLGMIPQPSVSLSHYAEMRAGAIGHRPWDAQGAIPDAVGGRS
jgi:hypothetical protein